MSHEDPGSNRGAARYGWIALAVLLAAGITGVISLSIATNPERHRQRVLELPFHTSVSESLAGHSETPERRLEFVQRVATTRVYEIASYVIADIGDVRLALASPAGISELLHESISKGSTVIDSNIPPELDGMGDGGGTGSGRGSFSDYRNKGVTTCTLDQLRFTIQNAEIQLPGAKVPVGKGRKVVFLRRDGSVEEVIDLQAGAGR
jgi:hypothetical protein